VTFQFERKKTARMIYEQIRNSLRAAYSSSNFEHGLTVDEIVVRFAKEFNISESDFKTKVLPMLNELRKKDSNVREFEKIVSGRKRIVWQWSG
jgi:hypothetical protein